MMTGSHSDSERSALLSKKGEPTSGLELLTYPVQLMSCSTNQRGPQSRFSSGGSSKLTYGLSCAQPMYATRPLVTMNATEQAVAYGLEREEASPT